MTECDTNRMYRPSRSSPAASIASPANSVSRNIASSRWAGSMPASVDPAASAAALVGAMIMSRVLDVRPPAIGPATLAYRP